MRNLLMLFMFFGLAAFLVGCATPRGSSRSTSQEPKVDRVACRMEAIPNSDAKQYVCRQESNAEAAKKRPEKPRKRVVCRRELITGSIIKRTICRDVWVDKERQQEDQRNLQEAQQRSTYSNPSKSNSPYY